MSALFQRRGQAAEFASVVDGNADDAAVLRYASLVATVSLMRDQTAPLPRADFVDDLRSRLMAEADSVLVPAVVPADVAAARAASEARLRLRSATLSPTSRRRRRERRLGALAAAFVIAGSTAGVSFAAQGALPGESLYSVKRGVEAVTLRLKSDDVSRGTEQLDLSATRLDEVSALMGGSASAERDRLVTETLRDFSASADRGADLLLGAYRADAQGAHVAAVRTFAATEMTQLDALAEGASTPTRRAFAEVADTLAGLDQEGFSACGACSSAGPLAVSSTLAQLTPAASLGDMLDSEPAQETGSGSPPSAADLARSGLSAATAGSSTDLNRGALTALGDLGVSGTPGPAPKQGTVTGLVDGVSGLVSGSDGSTGGSSGSKGSSSGTTGKTLGGVGGTADKATGGALGGTLGRTGQAAGGTVDQVTGGVDQLLGGLLPSDGPSRK